MKKIFIKITTALLLIIGIGMITSFFANSYYETKLNKQITIKEATELNDLNEIIGQYKGSLLYVDHSSVNCIACFEEMRDFVPQLVERYKNKPIKFIYVCSESNYPLKSTSNSILWRRKLAKLNAKGEHYLISKSLSEKIFSMTVRQDLGEFAYYPWQFIVDESGQIINLHAERPSNPTKLYKQLDSLFQTRTRPVSSN